MRTSWFDDNAQHPSIHEKVEKLKAFTDAMADGRRRALMGRPGLGGLARAPARSRADRPDS
jgi:hypothetical protein